DPNVLRTIKLDAPVPMADGGMGSDGDAGSPPPSEGGPDDGGPAADAPDENEAATDTHDAGALDADATPPPAAPIGPADVSITPSGSFAVVRREGSAVVTVINLADGSRWSWTLSGSVTDLDLADTGDRAVAVVRSSSRVAVLPVPGAASAPFDDVS